MKIVINTRSEHFAAPDFNKNWTPSCVISGSSRFSLPNKPKKYPNKNMLLYVNLFWYTKVIIWGRISIYSCLVVDAQTTINHNVMVMEMTTRCQIVRHLVGKNALSRDQARQRRLAAGGAVTTLAWVPLFP